MTQNEIDSARFHIRCCLRRGRNEQEILRQLRQNYGHQDVLVDLVRQEREIAKALARA